MATTETLPLLTVDDAARKVVLDAISQEPDPERLSLWLEIRGVADGAFLYDLYFQAGADAQPVDQVFEDGELSIVIPAESADRLRGARLEWSDDNGGGLVLVNPNKPPQPTSLPKEAVTLDGPLARQVQEVLDAVVNPSIASHGGRSDLVGIEEDEGVVYLRLSGGCQGCAMSRMTLTQGIETALFEEIPELTRVVDVTDHGSGENPFY